MDEEQIAKREILGNGVVKDRPQRKEEVCLGMHIKKWPVTKWLSIILNNIYIRNGLLFKCWFTPLFWSLTKHKLRFNDSVFYPVTVRRSLAAFECFCVLKVFFIKSEKSNTFAGRACFLSCIPEDEFDLSVGLQANSSSCTLLPTVSNSLKYLLYSCYCIFLFFPPSLQSVIVKSVERNALNMYEARKCLLGLESSGVAIATSPSAVSCPVGLSCPGLDILSSAGLGLTGLGTKPLCLCS